MEQYHWYGEYSDRVADICSGVTVTNVTNPSQPADVDYDWITTGGYTDGALLDGASNTKPSLTWSAIDRSDQPITIFQGGTGVTALKVPFVIKSAAPTMPLFVYNVPRQNIVYTVIVIFTKPNGEDTIIEKWQVKVS